MSRVSLLGRKILAEGVEPEKEKVMQLSAFHGWTNLHNAEWLGSVYHFRKYKEYLAEVARILTALTMKDKPLNGLRYMRGHSLSYEIG